MYALFTNIVSDTIHSVVVCVDFLRTHMASLVLFLKLGVTIIQNPESLCVRILKAKYFPGTHLLKTRVKEGCSYTWRSILQEVHTLKNGIV
jgi:hypothetical protein